MARTRQRKVTAIRTFREAIERAECLQWQPGLQAITAGEGKGRITARDSAKLLGSAFIDRDCERAPVGKGKHRWDYVLGCDRTGSPFAHFVEVHSAETSGVDDMMKKLRWLRDYLERDDQAALKKSPREFHWVASGRVRIPKHVRQYKLLTTTLRRDGLRGPVEHLELV